MQETNPYLFVYLYAQTRTEQLRREAEQPMAKSFGNSKGNSSGNFFGRSLLELKRRLAQVARTA
jgi:hypothetical protein